MNTVNEERKIIIIMDRYTNEIVKKIDIANSAISITAPVLKDKEDGNKKLINTECKIYYTDLESNEQKNIRIDAVYYTAFIINVDNNNTITQFSPLTDINIFRQIIDTILKEEEKIEFDILDFNATIVIDKDKNLKIVKNGEIINEIKYKEHQFEDFLEKKLLTDKYFKIFLMDKFFIFLNKKINSLN